MKKNQIFNDLKFRLKKPTLHVVRNMLIYVFIGILWIFLSDKFLTDQLNSIQAIQINQTYKGIFFILATAILFGLMLYREYNKRYVNLLMLNDSSQLLDLLLKKSVDDKIIVLDQNERLLYTNVHDEMNENEVAQKVLTIKSLEKWNVAALMGSKDPPQNLFRVDSIWYQVQMDKFYAGTMNHPLIIIKYKNVDEIIKLKELAENKEEETIHLNKEFQNEIGHGQKHVKVACKALDLLNAGYVLMNQESDFLEGRDIFSHFGSFQEQPATNDNKEKLENSHPTWESIKKKIKENYRYISSSSASGTYINETSGQIIRSVSEDVEMDQIDARLYALQDISEQPVIKAEIEAFKPLLDHIDIGIAIINKSETCVLWNSALEAWLGIEKDEVLGKTSTDLFLLLNNERLERKYRDYISGNYNNLDPVMCELNSKEFSVKMFEYSADHEIFKDLRVLVFEDLSIMRDLEDRIIIEKQKYVGMDQINSMFLSKISHEIRTPMNGIIGFADILTEELKSEQELFYVDLIRINSLKLLNTINSIIDISNLDSGNIRIEKSWFKIEAVMQELIERNKNMVPLNAKDDIKLKSVFEGYTDEDFVYTDKDILNKILNELLQNAINFTTEGYVELGCRRKDSKHMIMWVKDTGIGIKEKNLNNIFLPFASFRNEGKDVFSGLGFGLSIVKGFTEQLGGTVDVQSVYNEGTTVEIILPVIESEKQQDKTLEKISNDFNKIRFKNILLIEDSYESAELIKQYLKRFGITFIHADTGAEAVNSFFEHKEIDLVICDIKLPDTDGYELLKSLKKIREGVPVIAQTAFIFNEDKQKCLKAGFDDYIAKPIMERDLYNLLIHI